MHKAKKVKGSQSEHCWEYRGGLIEHWPRAIGRRGNWCWGVCGVTGWVNNKAEAKAKIDSLLAEALRILQAERVI